MGHHERGDALLAVQAQKKRAHVVAQALVQPRERLVQKQGSWCRRNGPGQGHALGLAAGERLHRARPEAGQLHAFDQLLCPSAPLATAHPGHAQRVGDVLLHRHMGEQPHVLEHEPQPAPVRGKAVHGRAVEGDAARILQQDAGDHLEEGGLARPRLPQKGTERAVGHGERHIAQHRPHRLAPRPQGQADMAHGQLHGAPIR